MDKTIFLGARYRMAETPTTALEAQEFRFGQYDSGRLCESCLNSYYVITILMSRVLTGKVRRVGNSMAIIIPKELLEESGAREGDTIKLSLAIPRATRETRLESIAGMDRKARPFAREKRDRF
ncbi:AbrB/MazE/SpoVT family DNA-binding domain-containing protein [Candidatus Bathyarchaeota archaeon]|nr:MAG: AbrB/MazE/SpoVT family DNA-binding domain-containing protein [Candidatus Bathyarchaeota archaeon]